MGTVGMCQRCGQTLCGDHGTRDADGFFVCVRHLQEAAAQSAADNARRDEQARRAIELQREQALQARRAAVPGFPEGGASARELSEALRRLAPTHTRSFVVERKSLGRRTTVRGWGFALRSTPRTNHFGGSYFRHEGIIVTDDGRAYRVNAESQSPSWTPGNYEYGEPPYPTAGVSVDGVQRILTTF